MKKLLLLLCLPLILFSCGGGQSQEAIKGVSQGEVEEFAKAAEAVANKLQPAEVELSFAAGDTEYRLDPSTVRATIIPFAYYNEEENHSLLWMVGRDINDPSIEVQLEMSVSGKLNLGSYVISEGNIRIAKESKEGEDYVKPLYYFVKNVSINVTSLEQKKLMDSVNGYSIEMNFGGKVAPVKGDAVNITKGIYKVVY